MANRSQRSGAGSRRSAAAGALLLMMLLAAVSLWTAVPLTWLYIGSLLSETQFPMENPYAVVAVGIVLSVLLVSWVIGRLNRLYIKVAGSGHLSPMRTPWLKSMRDTSSSGETTPVEAILITSVLIAAVLFVLWFFLLAGSPISPHEVRG